MATPSPKTCLTACLLLLLTVASLVASAPFSDHLDSPGRSHGLHVESHDKQDNSQNPSNQDHAQSSSNQDGAQSPSNQDDSQSPSNQDDAQIPGKQDVKNDNLNEGDIPPANLGSNNTLSYTLEERSTLTVNTNQENVSIDNREKQIISHNQTKDALENIKDPGDDVDSRSKGKPEEDDSNDDGSVDEGSKDDGSVDEGSDYSTSGPLLPQLVNSSEPGTHKRTFFDYVDVFDIDYTGYRPYAYRPFGSYGYSPYYSYGYDPFGFDYL